MSGDLLPTTGRLSAHTRQRAKGCKSFFSFFLSFEFSDVICWYLRSCETVRLVQSNLWWCSKEVAAIVFCYRKSVSIV